MPGRRSNPLRRKRPSPGRKIYAAGLLECSDNEILIVRSPVTPPAPRRWHFPRGPIVPDESPEAAMRRIALDLLDVHVDIVLGQPPLLGEINGEQVELRYFFCGVVAGDARPGAFEEIRWVLKGQLLDYEFDAPSKPVVDWLLER